MSVIMLASASGSPGVSTAAIAMSCLWRRAAIFVETDTAVTSNLLAGYFRGSRYHTEGLTNLLALDASQQLTPTTALGQRVPLGPDNRSAIPGFTTLEAGAASRSFWPSLANTLHGLSQLEHDIIVDAGRWHVGDDRTPLLEAADLVLLAVRPQVPEIVAAREIAARLTNNSSSDAIRTLQVVTINDNRSDRYSAKEIANAIGSPVLADIAHDSSSARVFSHGQPPPRNMSNRPYARSLEALISNVDAALAKRTQMLSGNRMGRGV